MDTKTLSAYEKNKPAIYKWRELNKEKYNDICNKAQAIYYQKIKSEFALLCPCFECKKLFRIHRHL